MTTSNPGPEPRTIIEAIDSGCMEAVLGDGTVARTHAGLEKASRAAPTCCTSVEHSQLGADAGVVPAEVEILDKGTTALLAMTPRLGHQAPQTHWPANARPSRPSNAAPVPRHTGVQHFAAIAQPTSTRHGAESTRASSSARRLSPRIACRLAASM